MQILLLILLVNIISFKVGQSQYCVSCVKPKNVKCPQTFWSKLHREGYIYILSTVEDPIFNNTDLSACLPKGHKIEVLDVAACFWGQELGINIAAPEAEPLDEMVQECERCISLSTCKVLNLAPNDLKRRRFWLFSLLSGLSITILSL